MSGRRERVPDDVLPNLLFSSFIRGLQGDLSTLMATLIAARLQKKNMASPPNFPVTWTERTLMAVFVCSLHTAGPCRFAFRSLYLSPGAKFLFKASKGKAQPEMIALDACWAPKGYTLIGPHLTSPSFCRCFILQLGEGGWFFFGGE